MSLVLKINVRHTDTDLPLVRTVDKFTNFTFNQVFNSFADTFSFDFYFDPKDNSTVETVCVLHMHECTLYYNGELLLTGYILSQEFTDAGIIELATISGYSKAGVLNDCDVPKECNFEIDGLSFKNIIQAMVKPFHIPLKIDAVKNINKAFIIEDNGSDGLLKDASGNGIIAAVSQESAAEKADQEISKTASETGQNVGSYLSELATQMNIPLSHTPDGGVWVTNANTKGTPIFKFDFTSTDPNNDARKIPGLKCKIKANGQALHTHIRVVQQADDETGTNAADFTIKNPLIPIKKSVLYRPRTVVMSSGTQFTIQELAKYELGKEIREAVQLTISMAKIELEGKLIKPNNTLTIINPNIFLFNRKIPSLWFIQSVEMSGTPDAETCVLNCVLPYAYDYDITQLRNVFVDVHKNSPTE